MLVKGAPAGPVESGPCRNCSEFENIAVACGILSIQTLRPEDNDYEFTEIFKGIFLRETISLHMLLQVCSELFHWFRYLLGIKQATNNHLNQCWLIVTDLYLDRQASLS